jgi:HEAT repeat protein
METKTWSWRPLKSSARSVRPAIPLLVSLLRDEREYIRRSAVDALIDLAPHTESIQPALRLALKDEVWAVAGDAARALGALGKRASPSVTALVKALSHEEPHVRIYAAEALASIGPQASVATRDLARAVSDPVPGVRWAASEALASIGPAAHPAVPQLIEALKDEFLYVRICAAGALGSIGPKAQTALEALRAAATNDPSLRHEAEWALNRIAGVESPQPVVAPVMNAPSIAAQPETTVAPTGNPPMDWDTSTGRNIVWSVELGNETYGRPVVAGDVVYVGTDNTRRMNPAYEEDSGVLMAFRATDGKFLWQDVAPRVERGPAGLPAAFDDKCGICGREPVVLCHRGVPTAEPGHKEFPRWREQWSVSRRGSQGHRCCRHRLGAGHVCAPRCFSA